jgi:hypothetical protein
MTMRVRGILLLVAAVAMMGLASCGHYTCGATFGSSSCTAPGGGLGTSGGTGSATAAFVFVADAAGTGTTGTIDGYTLNTTATTFGPTPSFTAPATPLNDGGVGLVVAQEKFLYTGFSSTDQIFGWSIGADGSLTAAGSPYPAPFMGSVPAGFGTQSIMVNPAGTLLFFSTSVSNVYVYQIGTDGALTAVIGSPFSVSFGGNLATDGLGNYLYITDASGVHTGTAIAAYVIGSDCATAGSACTLTPVPGSPFVGTTYAMWQVQGEPTGKYLIGTTGQSVAVNGGDNDNLYVFGITTSGANAGAITQLGSVATGTNSPTGIAVQSNTNGDLVYSFGIEDNALGFNPVDGFSLNSTGTLTALSTSPFSNAAVGDEGALDQSGAFLFVYGAIFNEGTQTFTYQMGAFDVGTGSNLGTLTEPTSTLTLTNGGYFAVTDPQ